MLLAVELHPHPVEGEVGRVDPFQIVEEGHLTRRGPGRVDGRNELEELRPRDVIRLDAKPLHDRAEAVGVGAPGILLGPRARVVLDVVAHEHSIHGLRGPRRPPADHAHRAAQPAQDLPYGARAPEVRRRGGLAFTGVGRTLARALLGALLHEEVENAVLLRDLPGRDARPEDGALGQRLERAELSGRALVAHAREVGNPALVEQRAQYVPFSGIDPDQENARARLLARPGAVPGRCAQQDCRGNRGDETGSGCRGHQGSCTPAPSGGRDRVGTITIP